ncbi:SH3 domain-containing kinase-binding protein 1-like [Glandiceps talaboti]
MVEAVVEYDYTAEAEDELSLQVGDIITNIETQEGGWWEGEVNGKKGMFPDNFVKIIKPKSSPSNRNSTSSPPTVEVEDDKDKAPPKDIKRPGADKLRQKRAKVTYSYTPQNEDELELKLGELVEVTKQEEPGWWEGKLNGKVGVFPSNFVEIVEEKGHSAKTEDKGEETNKEKATSPTVEVPPKKKIVGGVGLGDIFKNGAPKLRKTGNTLERGTQPPPVLPSSRSPSEEKTIVLEGKKQGSLKRNVAPPPPVSDSTKKGKSVKRAKVLFTYTAENPDELGLTEGDTISVLSQDGGDEGWWKGESNGKVGVFPDNFVKLIEEETETHHVHFQHPDKPKKPPPPSKPKPAPDDKSSAPVGGKAVLPQLHNVPPKKQDKKKSAPPVPIDKPIDTSKHKNKHETPSVDFDSVESSPDKLTHLTKFRAANPERRPPSLHVKPGDRNAADTDKRRINRQPSTQSRQNSVINDSGDAELQDLRSEIRSLRNTIGDLRQEFKSETNKLMLEIDEEKKQRMTMQVELDRLKRLVMK